MVKCNAIKANGDPCTLQAKYGEPPTRCRHHRDVSIEVVMDQLEQLQHQQHEIIQRLDRIENTLTLINTIVNTLRSGAARLPILNRYL